MIGPSPCDPVSDIKFAVPLIFKHRSSHQCGCESPYHETAVQFPPVLLHRSSVSHYPESLGEITIPRLALWDQRLNQLPFLMGEITRITQLSAVVMRAILARSRQRPPPIKAHHP